MSWLARLAYAILAGIVAALVVFVLGAIVVHFDSSIGSRIEELSGLIGLLVGIYVFFSGARPLN